MTYADLSVSRFLAELGSAQPAPGGGSAAALVGAVAAALCEMACRLTLSKESFREVWPAIQGALGQAHALETRFRALVDEDAQAYLAVVSARSRPRESAEQKMERKAAVQEAMLRAASVPLETLVAMHGCAEVADLLAGKANPSCITDVGTAGVLLRAGATAAAYNVRVNLPAIGDESTRNTLDVRARNLTADVQAAADRIAIQVETVLGQGSTK